MSTQDILSGCQCLSAHRSPSKPYRAYVRVGAPVRDGGLLELQRRVWLAVTAPAQDRRVGGRVHVSAPGRERQRFAAQGLQQRCLRRHQHRVRRPLRVALRAPLALAQPPQGPSDTDRCTAQGSAGIGESPILRHTLSRTELRAGSMPVHHERVGQQPALQASQCQPLFKNIDTNDIS